MARYNGAQNATPSSSQPSACMSLISGQLVRRRPSLYDPEVTRGKILVGVENAARADEVERALAAAGAAAIRKI